MLEIGALLQNRYEIIRPIGQGGMGAVYLARDQRLSNTVALKETFFQETMLLAAFEREARLLASLRHAALPKVIDHFADSAGQFLVMEYIPGEDLYDLMERSDGPAPVAEVLQWADQLLDALDYMHAQEPPIIHRDIKPQNLKLASRNQVVLLDFGLAKGTPTEMTRSNSASSIFGYTPSYAPLEQIQGSGTDVRSDLYSLSATLYHLLTGQKPVDALTRASAVLNGQPDPLASAAELNAQVPGHVSDVLMQGMALNKNQRVPSAARMREMLRDAARPSREEAANTSPSFDRTQVNQSESSAARPGASTHVFASAPATSAQVSEKTGDHAARASATNLRAATPARLNESRLNRPRPGTAAQRRSATVEVASVGQSGLSKVIAAGAILTVALAIVVLVFTRGVKRNEETAGPAVIQKTEPAPTPPASGDHAASDGADRGTPSPGAQPVAPSTAPAREEPRAEAPAADKEKGAEVTQEARQEEPRRGQGAPSMQEPEGTKPLPRQPEEEPRREPVRQERPAPPPPDQGPPPEHMYPPPPGYPPPGGPPPGGPPPGGPPPGRRRP